MKSKESSVTYTKISGDITKPISNMVYPYNYTKEGVKEYGFQRKKRPRELPKWGTQYEPWEV
tara:strand:- start:607 stop:792 length:186 start_codon:yes stop_codon:yes gene_type:complete